MHIAIEVEGIPWISVGGSAGARRHQPTHPPPELSSSSVAGEEVEDRGESFGLPYPSPVSYRWGEGCGRDYSEQVGSIGAA